MCYWSQRYKNVVWSLVKTSQLKHFNQWINEYAALYVLTYANIKTQYEILNKCFIYIKSVYWICFPQYLLLQYSQSKQSVMLSCLCNSIFILLNIWKKFIFHPPFLDLFDHHPEQVAFPFYMLVSSQVLKINYYIPLAS